MSVASEVGRTQALRAIEEEVCALIRRVERLVPDRETPA